MESCSVESEYKTLFVLSGAYTAIFTAYLAIQNLQSSLNQEDGLGTISLSCLYACIIISGILAPAIISKLGEKWATVVSFACHVIYTGSNFYPTFYTLIPSSVLIGLTAGPMWTSQSVYLSNRALCYAERTGQDAHATLTKFNGIFFSMYELTQITGNLISSLVLHQGTYDGNMSNETKTCGKFDCPISTNVTEIVEPERSIVYILLGVYLVCDVIGIFLVVFFLPPLKKNNGKDKAHLLKSVTSCGKALMDIDLLLLVPLIMFMAMEQAILWADYTKAFISCPIGIQKIGFVMAAYGISTTFFAFTMSRLSKYSGRHILFAVASLINLGIFIFLYTWVPSSDDIIFIFVVPVIWGISEGIWQTQSNALIALLFPEKTDAAFANYHTWKAVGFTVTFVYSSFLCVSTKLLIAIVLLVVAMFLYTVVEFRVYRKKIHPSSVIKAGEHESKKRVVRDQLSTPRVDS